MAHDINFVVQRNVGLGAIAQAARGVVMWQRTTSVAGSSGVIVCAGALEKLHPMLACHLHGLLAAWLYVHRPLLPAAGSLLHQQLRVIVLAAYRSFRS